MLTGQAEEDQKEITGTKEDKFLKEKELFAEFNDKEAFANFEDFQELTSNLKLQFDSNLS